MAMEGTGTDIETLGGAAVLDGEEAPDIGKLMGRARDVWAKALEAARHAGFEDPLTSRRTVDEDERDAAELYAGLAMDYAQEAMQEMKGRGVDVRSRGYLEMSELCRDASDFDVWDHCMPR